MFLSGSDDFTGGVRSCSCAPGGSEVTGGRIEGVAEPKLPLEVEGLGGECFVGDMPMAAGGKTEA